MPTQYFVTPLNISKIKQSTISKLKDKFKFNETNQETLFSNHGYYIIKNNELILYKIIHNQSFKDDNFLKKYTLLSNDYFIKKISDINQLPNHYFKITLNKLFFSLPNSDTTMVLEFNANTLVKLYFTSKQEKDNFFFNKDINLFLESLNI